MFSGHVKEQCGRLTCRAAMGFPAWMLVAIILPTLLGAGVCLADGGAGDIVRKKTGAAFCTKTAQAAFKACNSEAMDDYFIEVGNCNNLSDADERAECIKDARAELRESTKECKEQREARLEVCGMIGEAVYDPQLVPDYFVDPDYIGAGVAPNPYFPLVPGTQWIYEAETEEGVETITVEITAFTKEIEYPSESGLFFNCRVVRDVVVLDGEVVEDTDDWYAQDADGNVWYFGEISRNFEDGDLDNLDGSWTAGKDSAKPGILMHADPQAGDTYRQEFFSAMPKTWQP